MKTRTIITLILLAFAVNPIFAGPGKKASNDKERKGIVSVVGKPTGVIIKGQVWNLNNKKKLNQPMNGCEITVFDNRYNLLLRLDTKNNGRFSLYLQPNSSYIVIIKKAGYISKRIKIMTPQQSNTTGQESLNLVLRSMATYSTTTSR